MNLRRTLMNNEFDVVIVGSGITGALISERLAKSGLRVLVLEAGPKLKDRQTHANSFYQAAAKIPSSPWPENKDFSPSPNVLDLFGDWKDGSKSYLHQKGPLPFSSTWERTSGGAVNHWQGIALRHVPNDFKLLSTYDVKGAQDWPIDYNELEEWYTQAEHMIGVSGSHEAWNGVLEAYRSASYPMPPIPHTYLDRVLQKRLKSSLVEGKELHVLPVPQARNSIGRDGRPPCMGNNTCIPICPIQAKYDSAITLQRATKVHDTPAKVYYKSVATEVQVESSGKVSGISYKTWDGARRTVTARRYVIAANAVETPKLLLMSKWKTRSGLATKVGNRSDQVGRNLMDHLVNLGWALVDEPVYSFRGPLSTGTIEAFRDGCHRRDHSAFVLAVSNTGWGWAANAPYNLVHDCVKKGLYGKILRKKLANHMHRQISITAEMEQLPSPGNRVTLSKKYQDKLDIPHPEISYNISNYNREAFIKSKHVLSQIFATLGEEYTSSSSDSAGAFSYKGDLFTLRGAGHVMGTTRMGDNPNTSVVDKNLRCHDHENLFLVGSGVFPASGTANPTLTIAALALRAASTVANDLGFVSPKVKVHGFPQP